MTDSSTQPVLTWSDRIARLINRHFKSYQKLANKIGDECDAQTVRRWIAGTIPSRVYRSKIEKIEIEKGLLKPEDVEN